MVAIRSAIWRICPASPGGNCSRREAGSLPKLPDKPAALHTKVAGPRKSTSHLRGIGAAAVTLVASAGTAQAETNPTYFANQDGSIEVIYGGGGMAIYATIVDARNPLAQPKFATTTRWAS